MGVAGSGKSLIGPRLAAALGSPYFDADDFHSPANIRKMSAGRPLSDGDRASWLRDLAALLRREPGMVLGCSALRKPYRDRLRRARPNLSVVYLRVEFQVARARLAQRKGHFFHGGSMLRDQFALLEPPSPREAAAVDAGAAPGEVLRRCLRALDMSQPPRG